MVRQENGQFSEVETNFEEIALVNEELSTAIIRFEEIPVVNQELSLKIGDTQEGIRDWLRKEVAEAEASLSESERKTIRIAFRLWGVHSVISTFMGIPLGGISLYRSISRGEYRSALINLIPGTIRLATIIGAEKLYDVDFHWLPKVLTFIPTTPSGLAMPVAIARTLKRNEAFKEYLLERFSLK